MKLQRLILILAIIIGVAAAVLVTVYGWLLGQTIFVSTYSVKAGVNYWAT